MTIIEGTTNPYLFQQPYRDNTGRKQEHVLLYFSVFGKEQYICVTPDKVQDMTSAQVTTDGYEAGRRNIA